MLNFIKTLVLSLMFLMSLAAVTSTNENVGTDQFLIANSIQNVISQDLDTQLSIVPEVTAIPTPTPEPTVIQTPIPTPKPVIKKVIMTPTPVVIAPIITSWTTEQSRQRIMEVFGVNAEKAINIASCESGLNSSRNIIDSNGYHSVGLFQINASPGRPSITTLLDPEFNIQYAYNLSGKGTVWASSWRNCAKKYGYS